MTEEPLLLQVLLFMLFVGSPSTLKSKNDSPAVLTAWNLWMSD